MSESINIPEERKSILIGRNGETKRKVEKLTKTKVSIKDSIEIEGEPLDCLKAKEIVKAIGRGFAPNVAVELAKDDIVLYTLKVKATEKTTRRLLSRVIGSHGKAKKNIERLSGTHISIFGRTVSIIGSYRDVDNARNAIETILSGSRHGYVYKNMERKNL